MATTPTIFKERFREFSLTPDSVVEMAILESTIIMGDDVDRWGNQDMYYMANGYLIAHLLKVQEAQFTGDDSAISPIKHTAVDQVEVDYAITSIDPTKLDSEFYATSYGKRFIFYRSMCFTGGISV